MQASSERRATRIEAVVHRAISIAGTQRLCKTISTMNWIVTAPFVYPALEAAHIFGIACSSAAWSCSSCASGAAARAAGAGARPAGAAGDGGGFGLAATSGSLMFAAQAAELIANQAFVLKMGLLMLAGATRSGSTSAARSARRRARRGADRDLAGALARRHHLRPLDRLPLERRVTRKEASAMLRRQCIALAAIGRACPRRAFAHHGWSSFDQDKPIYLEGRADKVSWRNPHAEFDAARWRPTARAGRPGRPQAAGADRPESTARRSSPRRGRRRAGTASGRSSWRR